MKYMVKFFSSGRIVWAMLLVLGMITAGCATTGSTSSNAANQAEASKPPVDDKLRINDLVTITFQGAPDLSLHEERIKDDGSITLKHIGSIKAVGKTVGELQTDIQAAYVPKLYRNLVVTVKAEDRFFWVNGEVKINNRYVHSGQHTVLKAIATAGGFTDYAAERRVELTRVDGRKFIIDCKKAQKDPKLDLPVYPGDIIFVPKTNI
ncbi:MAG TPA: polysaccharide biosynthesis/export family protein [Verrucomicrobiae bacterium]